MFTRIISINVRGRQQYGGSVHFVIWLATTGARFRTGFPDFSSTSIKKVLTNLLYSIYVNVYWLMIEMAGTMGRDIPDILLRGFKIGYADLELWDAVASRAAEKICEVVNG